MNENLPLHVDGADFSTFGKPTVRHLIHPPENRPQNLEISEFFGFLLPLFSVYVIFFSSGYPRVFHITFHIFVDNCG